MSDLEDFYNNSWQGAEEKTEKRYPIILKMVGSHNKVLDVGCGTGLLSLLMKNQGNDVCGIDISEVALRKAELRGIKVKLGNIDNNLPFDDDIFDVVVCSEVIEHLFNPIEALEEIRRVLKPEGSLVLTTPNIAYILRRIALLFGKFPEEVKWARTSNTNEWEHIRFFTLTSLIKVLEAAGFSCIEIKGIDRFTKIPLSKVSKNVFSQGFCMKATKTRDHIE